MEEYALAFGVVFAINLLPAFGPPTWSILVLIAVNFELEPVLLVPCGAIAAALGRFTLAKGSEHARGLFSAERIAKLEDARELLVRSPGRSWAALGLFALSPVPSAQLFVAAGLLRAPLVPLTVAFFSGRLVSYSIYVGAASLASEGLGPVLRETLTSPLGVALQLLMVAGLVALLRVDWTRLLARERGKHAHR